MSLLGETPFKQLCDRRTDGWTDGRTNRLTKKWLIEVYECLRNIQKHLKCLYFMLNAFKTVLLRTDRPTDRKVAYRVA